MSNLCGHHKRILKRNGPEAYKLWQSTMQNGHVAHQAGNFQEAFRYFAAAAEITAFLLKHYSTQHRAACETALSLTEMRVNACHNLAATMLAAGEGKAAERVLFALHDEITQLCHDKQCQRWLRLDALTSLKNTLFSLVSYLGKQGKLETVRAIVNRTEEQAQQAAVQLLH